MSFRKGREAWRGSYPTVDSRFTKTKKEKTRSPPAGTSHLFTPEVSLMLHEPSRPFSTGSVLAISPPAGSRIRVKPKSALTASFVPDLRRSEKEIQLQSLLSQRNIGKEEPIKRLYVSVVSSVAILLFVWSESPAQWVQTNGSFPGNGTVSALAFSGTNLFAGTSGSSTGGAYLTTDNGTSWSAPDANLGNPYITAFAVSPTYLFAATDIGVDRLPTNGGQWTFVSSGLTNRSVYALAIRDTNLFAGTLGGVYLSTNNGTNWSRVSSGMTDTAVTSLAVRNTNLFAGTQGGHIFLSTNNGTNWTEADSGVTSSFVQALATIGTNIFAGTGGGVFLSTNSGTHWTPVTSGLTKSVYALLVSGTNLLAGTQNGVYRTSNNGTSWTAVNSGLGNSVYALSANGTYLFAGARGAVWRRPLSEILTSVEPPWSRQPDAFVLHQNYPNPFNPSTTIRYDLPRKSQIHLTVYNTLGQQVATLVQGQQDAGSYEVKFDGSALASGVYFHRLQAGTYVDTETLLLLR